MGDRHSHFLSLTGRKTGDRQAVMALGVLLEWNSWLVIYVCVCVCVLEVLYNSFNVLREEN